MPREERDFFERERLRKFRISCAGCVAVLVMYVYMTLGRARSVDAVLVSYVGAMALFIVGCIGLGYWKLRSPAHRAPNIIAVLSLAVVWIVVLGVLLKTRFDWIVLGLPLFMAATGLAILTWGFMSKRGNGVYCRACKYEKAPGSGSRCPECGTRWDRPGTTTVGRRQVHSGRVALGAVIACAAIGATQFVRHYQREFIQRMPTSILAAHFPHASDDEATEIAKVLEQRTLSPTFVSSLATEILDVRSKDAIGLVSFPALDWLIEQWIVGVLEDDIFERYVRETGAISIRPLSEPRASQEAIITLVDRTRWGSTLYPVRYILESLTLDDGTQLLGLADEARLPGLITSRFAQGQSVEARFTPTKPGPRRATLAYWLVVSDSFQGTLQWNQTESGPVPDYVPAPNTKRILWLKRYETTLDFTVAP